MTPIGAKRGFILACDRDGGVRRVVRDDTGRDALLRNRSRLGEIVEPGSRSKIDNFLEAVRTDGVAYNWEVNLSLEGEIQLFCVAGFAQDDDYVVIAAEDPTMIVDLVEQMAVVNNETVNELRRGYAESRFPRAPALDASASLDQISALNNELVTLSRRLEKANRELTKAIDAKNRSMGVLAHDLRNPLGVITGYAEMMEMAYGEALGEAPMEIIRAIHSSSRFMSSLVNDLLDFSSIESGKLELNKEPVDLAALIDHLVHLSAISADQKDIRLQCRADGEGVVAEADAVKITQVINNLLGNAIKFTPRGGRVDVALERKDGEALVTVEDTGQGVPEQDRDRIFQAFERSGAPTENESSTGLGLAISKRIVEGHGGRIWVDRGKDKGAAFRFTLPLA